LTLTFCVASARAVTGVPVAGAATAVVVFVAELRIVAIRNATALHVGGLTEELATIIVNAAAAAAFDAGRGGARTVDALVCAAAHAAPAAVVRIARRVGALAIAIR
jgi:hypothetical protein